MNYEDCLNFVMRWEGGFVNDPHDRGGATNRGVTQATYDDWRTRKGFDRRSVADIDPSEVYLIYLERYWNPPKCRAFGTPLDLALFDSAVQHGPGRTAKLLQEILNITADGIVGPKTIEAANQHPVLALTDAYLTRRERFYYAIVANDPSQKRFEKGWANRLADLRKECGL